MFPQAQSFGFNFANDDEAEEFYLAVTEARGEIYSNGLDQPGGNTSH